MKFVDDKTLSTVTLKRAYFVYLLIMNSFSLLLLSIDLIDRLRYNAFIKIHVSVVSQTSSIIITTAQLSMEFI